MKSVKIPAGMQVFYVRETQAKSRRLFKNSKKYTTLVVKNFPICRVIASSMEEAEKLAIPLINERIAKHEAKGFVPGQYGWDYLIPGNLNFYRYNIFVAQGCRRCGTKKLIDGCEHVKAARCFKCGGSGDEENPIHIDTFAPLPNPSGIVMAELPTFSQPVPRKSRAKVGVN